MNRRQFLWTTLAASIAGSIAPAARASAAPGGDIPRRALGRTGEKVSVVGLGGFHMGQPASDEEGIRIVRTAIDHGIDFMDNCWDYHDGLSEERMGRALRDGYRERVFLMTKIDGRDRKTAAGQIEQSLRRLQTDRIDLLQFHEVIRDDDPRRIFAKDGAVEAVEAAREAGKVRFVGFTGHKSPDIHLLALRTAKDHGYRFDAVQMPLNVMDAHYESFERKVLPALVREKIGVLGMKPIGSGVLLESGVVSAEECLRYALSLATDVVITGCDSMPVLEQALRVASGFRPLGDSQRTALLERTAAVARQGKFELYKTSDRFDGTAHHPQWLG